MNLQQRGMVFYHGTTQECQMQILQNGFNLEQAGKRNGAFKGKAINATTDLKLAKRFGRAILSLEVDIFPLYWMQNQDFVRWFNSYDLHFSMNEIGIQIQEKTQTRGYKGILIQHLGLPVFHEVAIYDLSVILGVSSF